MLLRPSSSSPISACCRPLLLAQNIQILHIIAGATPTGAQLEVHLEDVIRRLDTAVNRPEYGRIKPLDIVVLTDGQPSE